MGVDWWKNKHQPVVPILRIDMTSQHGQRMIWRILEQGRVKVVHFAPPCTVWSAARASVPAARRASDQDAARHDPTYLRNHVPGLPRPRTRTRV